MQLFYTIATAFLFCLLSDAYTKDSNKAELYNKNSTMQTSVAEDVLLSDLQLRGNEEVLDIGCGDGKITARLAQKTPNGSVTAIDTSDFMIDFAKEHNSHSNITYINMDVSEIDKIEKKFDAIVVFSAFHWFSNPKDALQKMKNQLKDGGRIFIVTYPAESQDWAYYKEAMLSNAKWAPMFEEAQYNSMFTAQMFEEEAKALGLRIKKNQVIDQFQHYKTIQEFKECVKGWIVWFSPKLPYAEYDEYAQAVVEKGKSQFIYDKNGDVKIPYKSMTVILEK